MVNETTDPQERNRHGRSPGCCLGTICVSLGLVLGIGFILNLSPHIQLPTSLHLSNNAYDELSRAADQVAMLRVKPPPSDAPQYRFALIEYGREAMPVALAVEQALELPYVAPSVEKYEDLITRPGAAHVHKLSEALTACAEYQHRSGSAQQELTLLLDGLEMCLTSAHGETVDGVLQILADELKFEAAINALLPTLDSPMLHQCALRLEHIRGLRSNLSDMLRTEGYAQTAAFQDLMNRSGKKGLSSYASIRNLIAEDENKPLTWAQRTRLARYLTTKKSSILSENLWYFLKLSKEVVKPPTQRAHVDQPVNLLASIEIGMSPLAIRSQLKCEVQLTILQTKTAVESFHLDKKRYPRDLTELCPSYLSRIPLDPASKNGTDSVSYSVNPLGKYTISCEGDQ